MKRMTLFSIAVFLFTAIFLLPHTAWAGVEIKVNNLDGAGEGFNDATPFTPVGGNPATTLGQARYIAFQFAANLWGSCLISTVVVNVDATFDPLTPCSPTGGVLGHAGATTVHANFTNTAPYPAPIANTWYPAALANAIAGVDLNPSGAEISAAFNSNIGTPGCLTSLTWYYGLDGNAPVGTIDFVSVVLHELGHGLGFQTFMNVSSGALLSGVPDTYLRNMENHNAGVTMYTAMSNAQRAASNIDDPDVHWIGPNVLARAAAIPLTAGFPFSHVQLNAPNPVQPGSSISHFSTAVSPNELMEPSYTGPNHNVGLARQLMQDIGWRLQPQNGTDVVFIYDITGSTRDLIPNWTAQTPAIANAWKAFDPNARFALVSHVDYPFSFYAEAGAWAYRRESALNPSVAVLTTALNNLPNTYVGGDSPESQYEAIYQTVTGAGRELTPGNPFGDPGEITPQPVGQLYPMVIYHFTYPQTFHDRDVEPNYPFTGSLPVAGRTMTINELATRRGMNMYFGLSFISMDKTGSTPDNASNVPPKAASPKSLTRITSGPLAELADVSGGAVYNVGTNLEFLQVAIDSSIFHFKTSELNTADSDSDGVEDRFDNCVSTFNPEQADADSDGVGDICDNCVNTPNPKQYDRNGDGIGDACQLQLYRTARMIDWARAVDAKGKPNPVKRKADKVRFKFNIVAPDSATKVKVKIGVVSSGALTRGKAKLDTLLTWIGLKEFTYTGTILAGDTLQVDGIGAVGSYVKPIVTWQTTPKARSTKVTVFKEHRLLYPMPNLINVGKELETQNGLPITIGAPKGAKSVYHKKYSDVQLSLIKKGRIHEAFSSCLSNAKQVKNIPPDKGDNVLFAEALALALNVAASDNGTFPQGFGEVIYENSADTSDTSSGFFNGKTIREILMNTNAFLTCTDSLTPGADYRDFYAVVHRINESFSDSGKIDTLHWTATKITLSGVRDINEVSYLMANPSTSRIDIATHTEAQSGETPSAFLLYQAYPNPFNPSTTIKFDLPEDVTLTLIIYDVLGREVATLAKNIQYEAGSHELNFNAAHLASGMYFYRLSAIGQDGMLLHSDVKKMLLVK